MTEEFDSKEIHGRGEFLVLVLTVVEIRRGGEGVDEDESRFGGIIGMGHLVASLDAA